MRKNQGITLVALVVTIVVLLVLAAVSINIAFGNNGIFVQAKQAASDTAEAIDYESNILPQLMQNYVLEQTEKEKTLANRITAANYGDKINYSANGITDWKILYSDGTNVFIIASDYVPNTKVPTDIGMVTNGELNVYWSSFPITNLSVGKYMLEGASVFNSENVNYKATASLLDTNKWSAFVDAEKAESAIGAPTLDMYIASWNAKYSSEKLYKAAISTGYYVGNTENPSTCSISMASASGYSDPLYYPHTSAYNGCSAYWLASPSENYINIMIRIGCDGTINDTSYNLTNVGVRPVVCLKSSVDGTKVGDTWNI